MVRVVSKCGCCLTILFHTLYVFPIIIVIFHVNKTRGGGIDLTIMVILHVDKTTRGYQS